jgi:hypothetical protein
MPDISQSAVRFWSWFIPAYWKKCDAYKRQFLSRLHGKRVESRFADKPVLGDTVIRCNRIRVPDGKGGWKYLPSLAEMEENERRLEKPDERL